ncbi:pilus retraction protein PilT [Oceanococcus atlanticus]|uniref:Pilus retraction protein PilT n=1 Tax=Oceanococcus atlanticus TaxID=1317117 RepID=A0A1Y1SEV1_9GAMM|nr:PilT/PilU family type 4a pilus ATPase [Oceanococcus atlanticus]ORE87508.1 pilus retraction protein PilT [Oceanococcus atlanticus]RZO87247.1 MAG: PilT/PilU family type 4a pilus ATPase [Oceanococcus sp.]
MMKLIPYLKLAVEKNASDIFFTTSSPAMLKVDGNMFAIGKQLMTKDLIKELAYSIMTPDQQATFEQNLEIDLATEAGGLGRFRVNIFNQRGNVSMVLRYVQSKVPTIDELGMPDALRDLIMRKRGLLLMVGATGSGKSTTLAAMLDHRNESAGGHILTIEDPIEFLHPNKKSIVNQREIGQDTHSYAAALKSSLREAPDVILVGEIRDRETMEAAIQLAGTGHLCISTLHANNAYQTLQRIINMFPEDLRAQLYMDLSINLRAIISQRLVRTVEGKRCAAVEVMINTPYIAELILRGEVDGIKETMADSQDRAMQTFDDALFALYKEGRISKEEALGNADSAANLESRIAFT